MLFTVDQLRAEVERRRNRESLIQKRINDFCFNKFGIEDFVAKAQKLIPATDELNLCLARQIPTINIEHLGVDLLARWVKKAGLNVTLSPLSFIGDAYSGKNSYKASLVKLPVMGRARNGKICCQNLSIIPKPSRACLEGIVLSGITTNDGTSLPRFHFAMREMVLGNVGVKADVSGFFTQCLLECLENGGAKPKIIFEKNGVGKEQVVPSYAFRLNGNRDKIRPPADWYYLIYLMLFLDGSRALLSTVDDDAEVSTWFHKSTTEIKAAVGFGPLIVDMPCSAESNGFKSHHLSEIPKSIKEGRVNISDIPLPEMENGIFEAANNIYSSLIAAS